MVNILSRPFHIHASPIYRLKQAMLFGLFVFLFLVVFQPFRIYELGRWFIWVATGFGVVTFLTMVILNIGLIRRFPSFYEEESWTVGREIGHTLLVLFSIGLFNFLYFGWFVEETFTWHHLIWFQLVTMAVGIFPITIAVLVSESIRRNKFSNEAKKLSPNTRPPFREAEHQKTVIIPSQNKEEEDLRLNPDDILFIKAADNYAEVYYVEKILIRSIVRNSLKALEQELLPFGNFIRCHKSYIVNTYRVSAVTGNAQGYQLHFNMTSKAIPVSRQLNAKVKTWFAVRP